MNYTINDFAMMEPMRYYDNPEPKTASLQKKRQDIIDNVKRDYIATVKHDGDWGMFIHYSKGHNLIRSRAISKVTGVYGDYTAKLPTAIEVMETWPDNTVILAEICVDGSGNNANTIGTILRCLPAKAVERQKEIKVVFWGFDLLMFDGHDMTQEPYYKRIYALESILNNEKSLNDYCGAPHFRCTEIWCPGWDFAAIADEVIAAGGEGLVLQHMNNTYMPGTRTAWKTLKLKQRLPEMELLVVDALDPTREYTGDAPLTWTYWEVQDPVTLEWKKFETAGGADPTWSLESLDFRPITKPYFYDWKSSIRVLYNNVYVDVASGPFSTEEQAWDMLNYIAKEGVTYFAFNSKLSTDDFHHLFYGDVCPICGAPKTLEFTRTVGFYTPTIGWSTERKEEFPLRQWMELNSKGIDA